MGIYDGDVMPDCLARNKLDCLHHDWIRDSGSAPLPSPSSSSGCNGPCKYRLIGAAIRAGNLDQAHFLFDAWGWDVTGEADGEHSKAVPVAH